LIISPVVLPTRIPEMVTGDVT